MLGCLLRLLSTLTLRFLAAAGFWLLGLLVSCAIRLAPPFLHLAVAATAWLLARLDLRLRGRLAQSRAATAVTSGGLWALIGLTAPLLLTLSLAGQPLSLNAVLAVVGFAFGLLCGLRAQALPGWGGWRAVDGLQLGKSIGLSLNPRGLLLSRPARATHLWAIGQPGTGKSRALESWIMADVAAGEGVAVIDPHSDLYDHLLKRIALLASTNPDLAERVILLNPLDPDWTVGFNPLQLFAGSPPERIAWFLTDVVVKIWKIDPSQAPRMVWLLVHTFMALSELGLTLVELPLFLRDAVWRSQVLRRVTNPEVRHYFHEEFPTDARMQTEWTQSTLNKMGAFVMDPDIRLIVGQRVSTIDFRALLDRQEVLLTLISKGHLGAENSQLLGAFLVAQIQQAALSRADTANRPPFYLYLDEFQNYTTDHIQEILSESRKYALSLVLAHQYLDQLPSQQKKAVLNTAGTLVCFRIGHQDAEELAQEVFMPEVEPEGRTQWRLTFLGRLPLLLPERGIRPLGVEWERYTQELTSLRPREFWVKRRGSAAPVKQYSLEMPDPVCPSELVTSLITRSGIRYGRRKNEVRRELMEERPRLLAELAGSCPPQEGGADSAQDLPPPYG